MDIILFRKVHMQQLSLISVLTLAVQLSEMEG